MQQNKIVTLFNVVILILTGITPVLADNIWSVAASLQQPRNSHSSVIMANGNLLVCGGANNQGAIASCEIFNPTTNSWTTAASMGRARSSFSLTRLSNGMFLAAGGGGVGDIPTNTAELYDPNTNTWRDTGSMIKWTRSHGSILLQGGQVLIAGGRDYPWCNSIYTTQIYDPVTEQWTLSGNLNVKRQFLNENSMQLLPDGKVIIVGGFDGDNWCEGPNYAVSKTEIFDPATNSWSFTGEMTTKRMGPAVVKRSDNKIVACGGNDLNDPYQQQPIYTNTCEVYDPATQSWSNGPSLGVAASGQRAVSLPSGNIMIVGGYNASGASDLTEVFNLNNRVSTAHLLTSRAWHTANILQDGKVITVGGNTGGPTSETFNPTSTEQSDFLVTAISLSPSSPVANTTFTAKVTVKNKGAASGDAGKLVIWTDQNAVQACKATGDKSVAVGTLAAGASKTLTFTGLKIANGGAHGSEASATTPA